MDAVKFLKEIKRLCKQQERCEKCLLYGKCSEADTQQDSDSDNINELVTAVEKWPVNHPVKTRLMDFLEKFPNALLLSENVPVFYPNVIGYCKTQSCKLVNRRKSV